MKERNKESGWMDGKDERKKIFFPDPQILLCYTLYYQVFKCFVQECQNEKNNTPTKKQLQQRRKKQKRTHGDIIFSTDTLL
jgi:hypothetical protein